jgi:hypothetical protein
MAEKSDEPKTLEMRIAAIEDKLSKMHVTEEEMKAYEKVAGLMGGTAAASPQLSPTVCVIQRAIWPVNPIGIRRPIITVCECTCGPCNCGTGGSGFGGGGFGGFGT